ncbi:MAG: hypothetical protein E7Z93_03165 [Cyanobacteria bacterium SIG32]|nr:hypothetical protein [Cyanobacteria bacterium SIG32]
MASIVNLLTQVLSGQSVSTPTAVRSTTASSMGRNPFVSYNGYSANTYAKNAPVRGGYFAGYYNGKQNIVGQRLFIEV